MAFTYWLPDEQGQKQEHGTNFNSVIIIGANGSGKSKLGAWIEQQNFENVHRIGAQRNLSFNENIALKSYSQAENIVFWGTDDLNSRGEKGNRWEWGKFTTKLMDDFENVLAALIALKNNENEAFVTACKNAEKTNEQKPNTPVTSIDTLQAIWNEVFPQRQLFVEDSKFYATLEKDGTTIIKYLANQMSDGERSVLYLAAQVLCVPKNKIMIIDEPEIHLHRSIMNRLWIALEKYRPDCLFIYITHDTQFAALHSHADKIWIREYDGENWKLEKLVHSDLPEELLLDILGNRNNVLFVEGERDSYDMQLYTAVYPQYHVVACGSCTQVISRTKAFRNSSALHDCQVYGIVDRDYRSDYEIESYKGDGIFTLNVAEVENLFLVEELVCLMASHLGKDSNEVFDQVKNYVVNTRFANQKSKQICQSVVAQVKYKLAGAEISMKNEADARSSLDSVLVGINFDEIKAEQETKFESAISGGNYLEVIKVFNEKGIAKSIGHFFGLQNTDYCSIVIALLQGAKRADIIASLLPYLPTEIPR